jgi:hypothetical protein
MPSDSEDEKRLLVERLDSEASLHWSRNSYFLVVMSILILAFGQAPVNNNFQLGPYRFLISILGAVISLIWVLIQYRSSQYISYYKKESQKLSKSRGEVEIYPKNLRGIEMRILAYILPLPFLILWVYLCYLTH